MMTARPVRGFSLLEILVAFVGIAMLLGVLMRLFGNGLETVRAGERFTRATVIAQSHLAAAGLERPLVEGVSSGTEDEIFHWRITVSVYEDPDTPAEPRVVEPLNVRVDVFWEEAGEPHVVSLTSIRLKPVPS